MTAHGGGPGGTAYEGYAFRQARPRYAEVTERTLAASARAGGRFNPAGQFGALSLDPDTPMRELRRQATRDGVNIVELLPRTLFSLHVRLQRVVDLTRDEVCAAWDIGPEDLAGADWTACPALAARVREEGWEAIRFPSATGSVENLAVFIDRLHPGSHVWVHSEEEVRPALG